MSTWTLVRRNLGRNRTRTILTTLAVGFSIFLVCAVMTLPSVRDATLALSAGSLRLVVHHKSGIAYGLLPLAYVQRVRPLPHVVEVSPWNWFGGVYTEPKDFFPNYAVDPDTLAEILPEIEWDPEMLETFKRTRDGALVGPRTMKKFALKIGDEITLRDSPYGVDLTFKIIGQMPIPEQHAFSSILLFPMQALNEAMQPYGGLGLVGMIWVLVDQPEHLKTVMTSIDDMFRNSETPTATETSYALIANFLSSFDSLITVIMLVGFLVVAAIVLIAANTAAMSIRERVGEVAVLKTLGFRRWAIFSLLLSEGLLVAGLGGGLGAGPAYLILNAGKSSWSPFLGPLAMFIMPVSVMIQGLFLALLIGMLAGVIPARGAARLNVATALRQIA